MKVVEVIEKKLFIVGLVIFFFLAFSVITYDSIVETSDDDLKQSEEFLKLKQRVIDYDNKILEDALEESKLNGGCGHIGYCE